MSLIKVGTIQGQTAGTDIQVPTGHKIQGVDTGSIYAPGTVVQCKVQTQTIGNTDHDADIESVSITSSPGFSNAYTINTVSITPKFSNSMILMQWSGQIRLSGAAAQGVEMFFSKDDANLLTTGGNRNAIGFRYKGSGNDNNEYYAMESAQYSFTSGQTTSMSLKVEINRYNTTGTIGLQHAGSTTLTVWEIAQ